MEAEFWQGRWREGRIGFHRDAVNADLVKYFDRLQGAKKVLVPLCGKTLDLWWLKEQGLEVVGIELVEDAVKAFFAEAGIEPETEQLGEVVRYQGGGVTLFAGDIFKVPENYLRQCDAIYDRAAVIALPKAMRHNYCQLLYRNLPEGGKALILTLEYDQEKRNGPPFSVDEAMLKACYPKAQISELIRRQAIDANPQFRSVLDSLFASTYLLEKA